MSWEAAKLGEVCTIEKGNIGIMKAIPGEYPLVVLGEDRKTHNEYQFDDEAVIIPLVSSTGHGHRSMKRIFFQKGKFSVGSILCAVIPKDKTQLSAEFLYRYLDFNKENELVARMKGMANVSLPMKEIALVEIPLPPLEIQKEFIKKFQKIESCKNRISTELKHQLALVKDLRQTYLREAMQGKLIPQDYSDEPADILHKRLKAEKEKPLSAIKPEVIPFEIPDNWTWCKLGDIGELKRGKSKHRPRNDTRLFKDGTYPFIQTGDVSKAKFSNDLIITTNSYYNEFGLSQSQIQAKGTLCITIAANIAECGFLDFDACVPDSIVCFRAMDKAIEKYIYYYLKIAKEELERFAPATAQKNINLGILNDLSTPLPPLAEQKRIIKKLERLMSLCDELEANIKQGKANAYSLMQTALKEALRPPISQAA